VENQRERFILGDSDICGSDADGGEWRCGGRGGSRVNILHLSGRRAIINRKILNFDFQSSCLCRTVNNRAKVIYCFSDMVPMHGDKFEGSPSIQGGNYDRNILSAQIVVWVVGFSAL
jgi:hypothetical protein